MAFNQKEFGMRIRGQRKMLRLTQQELSERIHADVQHVGRIERGEKSASIDLLIELSEVLEVSIDYLLTGKESNAGLRQELVSVIGQLSDIAQKM